MKKSLLFSMLYVSFFLIAYSGSINAAVISLSASIDGSQANAGAGTGSSGTGSAAMSFDDVTNQFDWNIEWSDLTGVVTVAHFHGPALPNANAPVEVTIDINSNPSIGNAILTDDQETDLLSGLWYINIHSDVEPGGEIRGQVNVIPIPAGIWLLGSGLIGLAGVKRTRKTPHQD